MLLFILNLGYGDSKSAFEKPKFSKSTPSRAMPPPSSSSTKKIKYVLTRNHF